MASTSSTKNSSLDKEELLTFLESYRNVIEFNTHVLEEVKTISGVVKTVEVDLREFHHKLDVISKDIFFKFEVIVTLLKNLETNYTELKTSTEEIKKVKELVEEIKKISEGLKDTSKEEHRSILSNVQIGWIALSTFFVTVLGGIIGFAITYYQEIAMLKKLLLYFGMK